MVQVMVEVRSGRWQERRQFEMLECSPDTGIAELKRRAVEAAAAAAAEAESGASRDLASFQPGELSFLGQACEDGKALRDYGVQHDWLAQVAGFVLKPAGAK